MDKEKERELIEIARDLYILNWADDSSILWGLKEGFFDCAKMAQRKGYRKADEVRKETAKEIFEKSEQRDMIELPCKILYKEKVMSQTIVGWQIIYRNNEGYIDINWFTKENDADKFLSKLKGEK